MRVRRGRWGQNAGEQVDQVVAFVGGQGLQDACFAVELAGEEGVGQGLSTLGEADLDLAAAVSAGSILQAVNVTATWHRTLQRGAGTIVGLVLAIVLFLLDYSPLGVIVLVVVCQMAAELVVMTNCSYAIVFVTPLTLALSGLAHPGAHAQGLAAERLWATVLGAVVGLLVCAVVANRRAGERARVALAACERAYREVRACEGTDAAARQRLARTLVALGESHALAAGEPWVRSLDAKEVEDVRRRARALLDGAALSA